MEILNSEQKLHLEKGHNPDPQDYETKLYLYKALEEILRHLVNFICDV